MGDIDFPFPFTDFESYNEHGDRALTVIDLRMGELSYALRSKPSWWTKIRDPAIRLKWKSEALGHEIQGDKLKEAEVDWVLDELEDYATVRDEATGIQPSCHVRVWESDQLVSEDLKSKLKSAASVLENVPDEEEDWHPRANNQVLDLVHPSLFCAVYDRTQCWDSTTVPRSLKVLEQPDEDFDEWAYSGKFCWIPTDFQLAENGSPAKALSYINNIHPQQHKDLVAAVEALVGRFSLLWDKVLTDVHPGNKRGLLICFEIQTPEKPEYAGGSWHVEGMANERIVASGIYYYDCNNITDSQLAFRMGVNFEGAGYEQSDNRGVRMTWGMDYGGPSNQVVGAVKTSVNRCIAFPNIYQHQVSPFRLVDSTKPGHRNIVALFLVDPENRIPSTTDIPPQQAHWIRQTAHEAFTKDNKRMKVPLPVELVDMVAEQVDNVMTLAEAKAYREELMDERTAFVDEVDEHHFCTEFNFCEH